MGGLTVLRALRDAMPGESFVYLGDTARLPYGTKTPETVARYAGQAAGHLVAAGVKAVVIACNTASATALPALQARFAPLPIFGVVEPGADAAAERGGSVALLATESTVRQGAYQRALLCRGVARVRARAAPLLVALAEEGATELQATILQHYLQGLLSPRCRTLLLGCTHFPVFVPALRSLLPDDLIVVDSASTTAAQVARQLTPAAAGKGSIRFLATDGAARFQRVGARFLGEPIREVELVDV